jgi:hypothetical protein
MGNSVLSMQSKETQLDEKALEAECAAYSLLHRQAIREYQRAFHTDRDPGVCDAAQQMREEIERLRGALVRWHRANETRDFIAADDALAAIAAELASEA